MSTINPIFQISRGLAKTVQKQGIHGNAANSVKEAFLEIQEDIFKFTNEARNVRDAVQEAYSKVDQAKAAARDVANRPADWRRNIQDALQIRDIRNGRLDQYIEAAPGMAMKESGLRQTTLKQKGLGGRGKEYAQVKSHELNGEKHASLKVNIQPRGIMDPAKYAEDTTDFAGHFVQALQQRSQFVSPRLAIRGNDHWAGLMRYQDTMEAFHTENATGVTNAQVAENLLSNHKVQAKVMQNGDLRIKLQNRHDVGHLSYKLPQRSNQSIGSHIDEGINLSTRIARVLDFSENTPAHAIKDNISTRFIRDNTRFIRSLSMSKKVDLIRLKQMEEAKQTLLSQLPKINELKQQNIFIKILRDGSFRITRKNAQGVIAQTKTNPFNQENMVEHILKGLKDADGFTKAVEDKLRIKAEKRFDYDMPKVQNMLDDGTLMNKVSTSRKLRNKTHKLKKAFLNWVG